MAEDLRRFLDDEPILAVGRGPRATSAGRGATRYCGAGGRVDGRAHRGDGRLGLAAGRMAALARAMSAPATKRPARREAWQRDQAEARRDEADRRASGPSSTSTPPGSARPRAPYACTTLPRPAACSASAGPGPTRRIAEAGNGPTSTSGAAPRQDDRPAHRHAVRCLDLSPDGRLLAVGCWDPAAVNRRRLPPVPVYLISVPDGQVRHAAAPGTTRRSCVAFRPDGRRLATVRDERTSASGTPARVGRSNPLA